GSPRGRWWSRGGTTSSARERPVLTINGVTLFPEVFQAALAVSIPGRAAERGLARYRVLQLRDYTHDRHHTVDDSPCGGRAGGAVRDRRRGAAAPRRAGRSPVGGERLALRRAALAAELHAAAELSRNGCPGGIVER